MERLADAPPAACLTSVLLGRRQASVVRGEALKFTRLTNDEIEAQLTALAERDDDLSKE